MSKGWESKNVEEQQAERTREPSPAASAAVDPARLRERQALELQRERILAERTSSSHRRSALTDALADIEEKLAELGWSVHL